MEKEDIRKSIGVKKESLLLVKGETQNGRNLSEQDINVKRVRGMIIQQDVWLVGIGDYELV